MSPANGSRFRLGFIVNPWAGIGGPAGLRGSDGEQVRSMALAAGSLPQAGERAGRFLRALPPEVVIRLDILTWGGDMGADVLAAAGIPFTTMGQPAGTPSTPADTRAAALALVDAGLDLLVFVGGDGTARDVCAAIGSRVPALGVPAGVKMYSGVFAVSPEAAAEVVARLLAGQPVSIREAEVRDIDEAAFRLDRVASRWFGELRVPGTGNLVQHVKCGPPGDEAEARREIGAWVADNLAPGVLYLIGTGSTPAAVLDALGLPASLLGIDALRDGECVAADLDAVALRNLLAEPVPACLVLTVTGGQGFLVGRGNQQLAADVIRRIGIDNLMILATPQKLAALAGRPLLVDSGDIALDRALSGWHEVVTGYGQRVLYRVEAASGAA